MKILPLILVVMVVQITNAQSYIDVTAANGNGFRFWNGANEYKIHMGYGPEYLYGPVTDYSIKTNINGSSGAGMVRGWTWGGTGAAPVAALNTAGQMQIAGAFKCTSLSLGNSLDSRKLALWEDAGANFYGLGIQGSQLRFQVASGSGRFSFMSGDTNEVVTFLNTGNVGIGTIAPIAKLHIKTTGNAIDPENYTGAELSFFLQNSSATNGNVNVVGFGDASGYGIANYGAITNPTTHTGKLFFSTRPSTSGPVVRMLIDENGNVGIGTKSPDQKLTVNGTIHAKEVKVDLSVPVPDYVFEKSYQLLPLEKVESYINLNKHLPEVASSAEMQKNGVNVSEMNMLLLKKVEELTLYIIEQEKRITALEKK